MANDKVTIANGTVKLGRAPANGELLIGNGDFFTLAGITAGTGISVTPGAGSITIAYTGAGGTVTSVNASGGTTGMTFSGGPITGSGTLTMAGTLAVANGGTGQTSYTDGQLLIGNSSGNTLAKATLTAGDGITITNGGGAITVAANNDWVTIGKSSDQSITNSSSLADDSELQFAVSANTTYEFNCVYFVTVGTGGIKISVNGPSSPTKVRIAGVSGKGTTTDQSGTIISAFESLMWSYTGGNATMVFSITGKVENGANSGTVAMRIAQSSSAANATTFEKGSWIEYRAM